MDDLIRLRCDKKHWLYIYLGRIYKYIHLNSRYAFESWSTIYILIAEIQLSLVSLQILIGKKYINFMICALCCLMLLNIYQTYTWVFGFHWCNHGLTYVKFYFRNCIRNCICKQCVRENLILFIKSKCKETNIARFSKIKLFLNARISFWCLKYAKIFWRMHFPHEWISYQGRSC